MRKLTTPEMHRLTVEEFHEARKLPLVVVLDDVRSMYNVGSVFRTCDAFRVQQLCLCGITGLPPHSEIHKTALGAEDSVAWRHYDSALEAVRQLHEEGFVVYAVEQAEGSTMLQNMEQTAAPLAIVFGNEVKGVHQEVVDACDGCLEIPQFGTKHSLNVSVTAGMVIWELAKKYIKPSQD